MVSPSTFTILACSDSILYHTRTLKKEKGNSYYPNDGSTNLHNHASCGEKCNLYLTSILALLLGGLFPNIIRLRVHNLYITRKTFHFTVRSEIEFYINFTLLYYTCTYNIIKFTSRHTFKVITSGVFKLTIL